MTPTLQHSISPAFSFVTLLVLLLHSPLWAQSPFYAGKTLKIVVGSASGGGYDLWARLLAQHIGKHIPGHPSVIVQNMPGAGGLVAGNFIYGLTKPDGLTVGAFNPALYFEQLVAKPEAKFDWSKFTWIGSPEHNDALHYIRADSPYKNIDDLRNAKEPPKCGSTGGGTTAHYFPHLLEDTLGIKTTQVTGYQGGSEIDLAVERNEIVCWTPLVATYFGREPYKRWHKTGFVRIVVQTGDKRDPRLKDVPTLWELMQQYKTPEASRRLAKVVLTAAKLGRPIAGPPRIAPELTRTLRDAYTKSMKDPELLAEAAKRGWEVEPHTGAELEALAKEVINQPKEVIERAKWVLGN